MVLAGSSTAAVVPLAGNVTSPTAGTAGTWVGEPDPLGANPLTGIVADVAFLAVTVDWTTMRFTPLSWLATAVGRSNTSLTSAIVSGWFTGHGVEVSAVTDTVAAGMPLP